MAPRPGFDKLAPCYRHLEGLLAGCLLQRARMSHVDALPQVRSVLMLGEGPGRLLEHLVQKHPTARFLVVDQSQNMLNQARTALRARSLPSSKVTWLKWDVSRQGIPSGPFDLITTPFFLDCFNRDQLAACIPEIASQCSGHCDWLVCDFQIPRNGLFRRWRAKGIHWLMYLTFRMLTQIQATHWEDPDSFLQATGFRRVKRREFSLGLIRSDHWIRQTDSKSINDNADMLRSIRKNGDSNKECPD